MWPLPSFTQKSKLNYSSITKKHSNTKKITTLIIIAMVYGWWINLTHDDRNEPPSQFSRLASLFLTIENVVTDYVKAVHNPLKGER